MTLHGTAQTLYSLSLYLVADAVSAAAIAAAVMLHFRATSGACKFN